MQENYIAGEWEQIIRNKDHRPYVMYDAINDSRVRPAHLALDNIIRRWDDPFWHTHSPPNGYRCRCSLITLTEAQAQDRSGPDKGLNKQPVYTDKNGNVQPANPDKGWDYNPSSRLEGIKRALANKQGKVSERLLSTYSTIENSYNDAIMKTIKLSESDKILLNNVVEALTLKRSEWLSSGNLSIFPEKMKHGFAEAFIKSGIINLSTTDAEISGFIPAQKFVSALRKMANNELLLFDEEYSVEIVWHEILHIRTPLMIDSTYITETITQFIARHTYDELLEVIGKTGPVHKESIISSGYGYLEWVANFRYLLHRFNIDETLASKELYAIYLRSDDSLRSKVAN